MSRPEAQVQQPQGPPTPEEIQAQQNSQRIMRAIQVGIAFLNDETVTGPIKYADGISDLKWLLRNLASGIYGINLDPNQQGAGASSRTPPGKRRDLSEYDGEDPEVPEGVTKQ